MVDRRPLIRAAVVAVVVALAFAGAVYVNYGVERAEDIHVVESVAFGAAAVLVLAGARYSWPVRTAGALAALGVGYVVLGFWVGSGIRLALGVAGIAAIAAGHRSDWRAPVPLALALLGVFLFAFEAGGSGACNAMGYPDSAGYGMEYHWRTGELYYGDNHGGDGYRCVTTVDGRVAALGYLFAVVGIVEATGDDGDDS